MLTTNSPCAIEWTLALARLASRWPVNYTAASSPSVYSDSSSHSHALLCTRHGHHYKLVFVYRHSQHTTLYVPLTTSFRKLISSNQPRRNIIEAYWSFFRFFYRSHDFYWGYLEGYQNWSCKLEFFFGYCLIFSRVFFSGEFFGTNLF